MNNQLVVNNGKLVVTTANVEKVATKKVVKKVKFREIYILSNLIKLLP